MPAVMARDLPLVAMAPPHSLSLLPPARVLPGSGAALLAGKAGPAREGAQRAGHAVPEKKGRSGGYAGAAGKGHLQAGRRQAEAALVSLGAVGWRAGCYAGSESPGGR